MKIKNAKALHEKSKTHEVQSLDAVGNTWQVTSGTSGKHYVVRLQRETRDGAIRFNGARCSCPWGQYRPSAQGFRSGCSHVQAVFAHLVEREQNRTTSAWASAEDARRQHRPILALDDGLYLTTRAAGC